MAEENPNLMTGAEDDEEPLDDEEPVVEDRPAPTGGFMSAEDVERLLTRQTEMMREQNERFTQTVQQSFAPPPQPERRALMPTAQEVQEAFETGDGKAFMDVYQRSLQAVHSANEARVAALEQEGMQRINQLSADVVRTTMPDYTKYEKQVNSMMDEYQIGADLRGNPKVVELFTKAAKADNIENEIAQREEANKRRAAQRQTADSTPNRRAGGGEAEEPLFGLSALQALRNAGRSPDQHAQALGYANWEAYNQATAEKYANWQDRSVPAWRKRLNERRTAGRRR